MLLFISRYENQKFEEFGFQNIYIDVMMVIAGILLVVSVLAEVWAYRKGA